MNLQPPGRDETKKRNPVLPITDALLPWLAAAHRRRISCPGTASRWTASRAPGGAPGRGQGCPSDFTPYSVRHALATELRARGVPEWECAGWLGHSTPYRTTEIYARFRPDYLSQARAAIDAWVKEIGVLLEQDPGHVETPVRV